MSSSGKPPASGATPAAGSGRNRGHDRWRPPVKWVTPDFVFRVGEDLVHYAVAAVLLVLAVMVLYNTIDQLVSEGTTFASRIIDCINGVLFVIIVMELLHTVLAHFERGGFQLQPFLIIGIISAVRHILTIGARLTLTDVSGDVFRHSQIELGVNSGVVLGLAISLLMVRNSEPEAMVIAEDD
jgi:uncharacterized membrane protein (DUF373 family)